jgi:hypothetical protein
MTQEKHTRRNRTEKKSRNAALDAPRGGGDKNENSSEVRVVEIKMKTAQR